MALRILLADDHPVVRQGIKNTLEKEPDFNVVGEFKNGHELMQSALLRSADVLLLDLNMERTDGLQVLKELQKTGGKLKTIVISAYDSRKLVEGCRESGASAYILKTEKLSDLHQVIRSVIKGEKTFPDFASEEDLSNGKFSYFDNFLSKYKLTTREVEIIKMVCEGMTSAEIADKLFLSAFTIQTHRKNIFKKLKLDSSNSATLYDFASKNGLL